MEIPIYYNFADFKNDYQENFKKWNEFFPDAVECDFINDQIKTYKVAIKNVTLIEWSELGILETVSRLTGEDIINEIEYKIYNEDRKEFDFNLIKNFDFTFNRILEFLLKFKDTHNQTKTIPELVEPPKPLRKGRTSDVNFKFALLQEMGVIKWLENNILTNNDDRAEILQEIMGGSIETLKDYLKGKTINKDVRQKALDLLNSKRFPK